MEAFPHVFYELLIFMGAGLTAFLVCRMLGLSMTLGYLLVGVAIGPSFLGLVQKPHLHLLGELGVLVLLFVVGLELPTHRLQSLRHYIFGLGLLQISASSLCLGFFIWLFSGLFSPAYTLLFIAFSFSSTALVIQLLTESDELSTKGGRATFSILLLQDITFVFLLVMADFFVNMQNMHLTHMVWTIGSLGCGIFTLYYGGRWAATLMGKYMENNQNSDMPLFLVFTFILGMGYLGTKLNLSAELGAFIAGLSWADTRFRRNMEHYIRPFRIMMLSVFFMLLGVKLDMLFMIRSLPKILPWLFLILSIKIAVSFILGRFFRLSILSALKMSILIAGCGEFIIILLDHPLMIASIDSRSFIVMLAIFSMVLTPFLWLITTSCIQWWQNKNQSNKKLLADSPDMQNHVVVAGFGRTGALIVPLLEKNMIPYVAFDYDMQRVRLGKELNHTVLHGDARELDFLKKIGVHNAKVFLITFDNVNSSIDTVSELRDHYPDLEICSKIHDLDHAHKLERFGVHVVMPENLESSIKMVSLALHSLGFQAEDVHMMLKYSHQV